MLNLITYLLDNGYGKSKTLWGVCYALKHPAVAGMPIIEAARYLGCTRQSLHSHILKFKEYISRPLPEYNESDIEFDFADLDKIIQQTKTNQIIKNGNRRTANIDA